MILYVRFFRMAERRIAEKTGQGVVCFISNYSWLDGSCRSRVCGNCYLEAFDVIRIDCLNGDRMRKGGHDTDGRPRSKRFRNRPIGRYQGRHCYRNAGMQGRSYCDSLRSRFRHLWGTGQAREADGNG